MRECLFVCMPVLSVYLRFVCIDERITRANKIRALSVCVYGCIYISWYACRVYVCMCVRTRACVCVCVCYELEREKIIFSV